MIQKVNQLCRKCDILERENGIDTSDANATSDDILLDKTAYVNGVKIVGTYEAEENSIDIATGSITTSYSSSTYLTSKNLNLGFRPTKVFIYLISSSGADAYLVDVYYDEDETTEVRSNYYNLVNKRVRNAEISEASSGAYLNITDLGFSCKLYYSSGSNPNLIYKFIAIGE